MNEENKENLVLEEDISKDISSDTPENVAIDQTPKKPPKVKPFIVTLVLACLGFVVYSLFFILFSSAVFDQNVEDAGEVIGIIFSLIILLVPVFASALWTVAFSIASAFCKKKAIRIIAIVIMALTAVSATTVFTILFTR